MADSMDFIDIVLDGGELVRIECPSEHIDRCYESIENAMKRKDWWSPSIFDGCKAEYLGLAMDRINMGKAVGML